MKGSASILVVDDNDMNRELLSRRLNHEGYQVYSAEHGGRALSTLSERDIDLVLLDIVMPVKDGFQVLFEMKSNEKLRDIPVIVITADDEIDSLVRCVEMGADDYLTKPFNPVILRARINSSLEKKIQHGIERRLRVELEAKVKAQMEELISAQLGVILAMSKLAESKDPETGAHLERMQEYCRALANNLSKQPKYREFVDSDFIEALYCAAPLHDIGKVGIPDSILLKPGKLSEEEFEVMKSHTSIGASTLLAVNEKYPGNQFVWMGIEIAQSHHEKWDGSGYPDGLVGLEIPLSARILALSDVYDALTSKRCYKEKFSHEKAKNLILEGAASHFDPEVVDAFLNMEDEFIRIRREVQEQE